MDIEEGYEFDWIGIDKSGNIGIFSTGGSAFIPDKVLNCDEDKFDELWDIINNIPASSKHIRIIKKKGGDFTCWDEYAKQGLFGFDYQDPYRDEKLECFDLLSKPTKPINISDLNLNSDLLEIIPVLDCDFNDGNVSLNKI